MTTVKVRARKICAVLLCVLLAVCLSSCSTDGDFGALESLQSSVGVKITTYYIILPSGCTSELAEAARELESNIEGTLDVDCRVIYDNEEYDSDVSSMPIFVGNADGVLTQRVQDLHRDDYIYHVDNEYMLLGGLTDNASIEAINRFLNDVLPNCESSNIFEYDGDFAYSHTYELKGFMLCSFDFGEYDIILSEDRTSHTAAIARAMREKISKKTGSYPNILTETKPEDGRRELVFEVGENVSPSICFDGEDVVLIASDTYGFSVLAEKLYSLMLENISDGKSSLQINEPVYCGGSASKISAAMAFVDLSAEYDIPTNANQFATKIEQTSSDIIFFGNANSDWLNIVRNKMSEAYEFEAHDGIYAVAYRKAVMSCDVEFDASVGMITANVTPIGGEDAVRLCVLYEPTASERAACVENFEQNLNSNANTLGIYSAADVGEIGCNALDIIKSMDINVGAHCRKTQVFINDDFLSCQTEYTVILENSGILNFDAELLYSGEYLKNICE